MSIFRWLVLAGLLNAHFATAEIIQGSVVAIADGDTITVLDAERHRHKVRLAGIDAPEKKQAFGEASKKHLSGLIFGREVTLNCGKRDKYQREVCIVIVDGQDINLAQVASGMAWWYRKYQKEQTIQQRDDYERAGSQAKKSRAGLWSDIDPEPPWDFRHRK